MDFPDEVDIRDSHDARYNRARRCRVQRKRGLRFSSEGHQACLRSHRSARAPHSGFRRRGPSACETMSLMRANRTG